MTTDIIRKLDSALKKRIRIRPKIKLILHTDRGTQFSNAKYNEFLEKNNDYVVASMSKANSPKDNAVIERFIRTFKEHKIKGKTFQNELLYQMDQNANFRGYRRIFNLYIKSLDLKPNKKKGFKTPHTRDSGASVASKLMIELTILKHFQNTSGKISGVIISINLRSTVMKLSTHLMILQLSDQRCNVTAPKNILIEI